jgi:2-succinyl-6-hydroxy-2,4-cyclohexadiene-1-carboxylate synthase
MPIRDLETYLTSSKHDIDVFFNRGVNGIDGLTATATGIARARGGTTVLLTGDIAFLHDLDGLLACGNFGAAVTIVVINNNGGEIFNHLPVREFEPAFTEHFVTPHGLSLEAIARAFRIEYHAVEDAGHYGRLLEASVAATGVRIIEFRSNAEAARNMRAFVTGKVKKALEGRQVFRSSTTGDEADAAALYWRLLRRGSGSLTPVILLHGFTRSGASWEQAAKFMSAGRSVIAVDLPGHGSSPCPQGEEWYSFERLDDMLLSVLDRTGTDIAHLAGYSLGGRAALHFALSHPERIAGLALISASPGIEDPAARERRRVEDRLLARKILEEGLESFVDAWADNPVLTQRVHTETARRGEKEERMSGSAAGYAFALEGLGQGAMKPLWTALPGLTIPTLVIAGERDGVYSDISGRMADLIPDSKLLILPDCGHDAPAESPEAMAAALDGFWDGI